MLFLVSYTYKYQKWKDKLEYSFIITYFLMFKCS